MIAMFDEKWVPHTPPPSMQNLRRPLLKISLFSITVGTGESRSHAFFDRGSLKEKITETERLSSCLSFTIGFKLSIF